ncbi:MAG: hypothetical protein O7C75_13800 [Verrucomicrobia bacterium]|nr:hypothetical protein [Verrucomicrobiota bacterium]
METIHRRNMENPNSSMKMQQPKQNRSLQANVMVTSYLTSGIVVETPIQRAAALLTWTSYPENHSARQRRSARKTKTAPTAPIDENQQLNAKRIIA